MTYDTPLSILIVKQLHSLLIGQYLWSYKWMELTGVQTQIETKVKY